MLGNQVTRNGPPSKISLGIFEHELLNLAFLAKSLQPKLLRFNCNLQKMVYRSDFLRLSEKTTENLEQFTANRS
jgi:hypothetical protein